MTMKDLLNDPGKLEKSPFLKNLIFKDKKKLNYFLICHQDTTI